ncbi:MAG TPA: hypothetical protein ENJ00_02685 [Phycisphaerales bacterium]|nr:hypothetical protein [Phycisphaerales bacterium]
MNQTLDRAEKKILGLNPLVLLNVVLLGVLGAVSIAPAQPGGRARGDYAMVGGEYLGGGGANAVYILDAANQELIAIKWDSTRNLLDGIGFRDLAQDAKERAGR